MRILELVGSVAAGERTWEFLARFQMPELPMHVPTFCAKVARLMWQRCYATCGGQVRFVELLGTAFTDNDPSRPDLSQWIGGLNPAMEHEILLTETTKPSARKGAKDGK